MFAFGIGFTTGAVVVLLIIQIFHPEPLHSEPAQPQPKTVTPDYNIDIPKFLKRK